MEPFILFITPENRLIEAAGGENLLSVLQKNGFSLDAACGGNSSCANCRHLLEDGEHLACQTIVDRNMVVTLPKRDRGNILAGGVDVSTDIDSDISGNLIAIDLGTTTMVCYLLDQYGRELAVSCDLNPQGIYGADVISRIQAARQGKLAELSGSVRAGLSNLIGEACAKVSTDTDSIQRIALVGNPCMQQLLMNISPENLTKVPFSPILTELKTISAAALFPGCPNAEFIVVPDISGYIGADTVGCILSTKIHERETIALVVDIGTNGEMVLGDKRRMLACSTAAGPALEGANIRFGMRGSAGAIDHVKWKNGKQEVHVIGEGRAVGICGSGLIDAVAGMLENGIINHRGRIQTEFAEFDGDQAFYLTEDICLTQNDIRQVQLAKGAIAAGIELMTKQLGIALTEIHEVLLAGAFGSFIDTKNACAIGLLPPVLLPAIRAVGNAAGSGAKLLACSRKEQESADRLCQKIEFLELASLTEFQCSFRRHTNFAKERGSGTLDT
ncbi:MAG: ASKHA domain-containing protein, partial [Lachnospiraceae bacterium]|nr:ASKHA domain-containing protein [Lachnospiraceae bacterium]